MALTALVLFHAFTLVSCNSGSEVATEAKSFPVIRPLITDTARIQEYVADIHSVRNIEIRAKAGGFLEAIHIDEGAFVRQGQLLFSIGSKQYEQALKRSQAALASALAEAKVYEVEVANTRHLFNKQIVAQSELELAESRLETMQAKAEVASSEAAAAALTLTFAQIKAPFDGYINRIRNKSGSLIEEGTLLTTISDNREVFAYFNLSEREYLDYAVTGSGLKQATVRLRLANNALYPVEGVIETGESEIDKNTGNIAFRARFPNPDNILRHGSSGKIQVRSEVKQVMLIPQKSTFEIQEKLYVMRVKKDSTLEAQVITPVMRLSRLFVVQEGLHPTDQILFEGVQQVRPGDRIIPVRVDWASHSLQ